MNIPLNIDWQQILLHLLNFVILAGGLYLLLYKPVKAFMEKRQQYYQEQDAKAAKTLADAEKIAAEVRQQLKNADADAAAASGNGCGRGAALPARCDCFAFHHGRRLSSSTIRRGRLSQCLQHFMSTEYIRAMQ